MDIFCSLKVVENYFFKYKKGYIFLNVITLDVFILERIDFLIIKALNSASIFNEMHKLKASYGHDAIQKKLNLLILNGIIELSPQSKHSDVEKVKDEEINKITSLDLLLTEDCNLACKYCFVKNGIYNRKTASMSLGIGKKAIEFLIQKSGNQSNLHLCFFGGEPLLNFTLLKEIVSYAVEEGDKNAKNFHFTITTNGTLLNDEIIDFFEKHDIRVTISIDGDKKSHDVNRPISRGGSSYDSIVNKLELLNQSNISFAARATISSLTTDKIASNYEHLQRLGFKGIRFESAYNPQKGIFVSNKNDIIKIKEQYTIIAKEAINKIKAKQRFDVQAIPLPLRKIVNKSTITYSCKAGRGYVAVDIKGDIYLCHRLVGEKKFLIGNVVDGSFETEIPEFIINEMNVARRTKCKKCWARHLCAGGCYAVNHEFHKDISKAPRIYCQEKKHSIKLALMVYANAAQ
jgi:uncharacterized protein